MNRPTGTGEPRWSARINSRRQVTFTPDVLRAAALEIGERLVVRVAGPGRIVLERAGEHWASQAGMLTGVYEPDELNRLRSEWRR